MVKLNELLTREDLEKAEDMSSEKPVLLFKQSTTCPISADAFEQYNSYLEKTDEDIDAYFVKVRETREVSNQIAEDTGIQHQSPQIFLMKNKEVLWHTSHSDITAEHIEEAVADIK